jgi:hypothetical protein
MKKETFWSHQCHLKIGFFLAPERGDFTSVLSLVQRFCLWRLCSLLFGLFRFASDFVSLDKQLHDLNGGCLIFHPLVQF